MPTTKKTMTPAILLDQKIPIEHRKQVFADLCTTETKEASRMVDAVLQAAASNSGRDLYRQKKKEVEELIESLRNGPQRPGVFVNLVTPNGSPLTRAHVKPVSLRQSLIASILLPLI